MRDGVALGYEVYGEARADRPTILLLPTWTIIHSRFWKMQVPYLARHFQVVVYDGPGNGRSDRVTDPARYTPESYAVDAAAVLDACGVERAVAIGLSRGAWYALELAALRPDAIAGLVLVGSSLPLAPA
ncbi:MAG: alpha/beta hydrolase, partial [Actinomycetota bacterium]|nr:alpha/beta hydrolase [Actinomycetota bacterium]